MRHTPSFLRSSRAAVTLLCLGALWPRPLLGEPIHPSGELDLGFLFYDGSDVAGHDVRQAAGPVFERKQSREGLDLLAVRPFYCVLTDEARQRQLRTFLWPAGMWKTFQGETDWRLLLAFGHDFDNARPESRHRYAVFPILFGGRDARNQKYVAVFPLGGRLNEFLGRDEIVFILFPLYSQDRINDVKTRNVLWPIVSWSSGPGVKRFRVFPLYGRSEREDRWVRRFVLWPFWTSIRSEIPDAPGGGFILFPLVGHAKAADRTESWMVLPPFFRVTKGDDTVEANLPWPFVQYASGRQRKLYLWPLWGRRATAGVDTWFCAWPFIHGETLDRPQQRVRRFVFLPLVQLEKRTAVADANASGPETPKPANEPVTYRYAKIWPLFRYERDGGESRFSALDLWPFKHSRDVDRHYTPFWTLYSRSTAQDTKEDELLWGLFRWRRDGMGNRELTLFPFYTGRATVAGAGSREWRLLGGLAGCRREGLHRTGRFLYLIKWRMDDAVDKNRAMPPAVEAGQTDYVDP